MLLPIPMLANQCWAASAWTRQSDLHGTRAPIALTAKTMRSTCSRPAGVPPVTTSALASTLSSRFRARANSQPARMRSKAVGRSRRRLAIDEDVVCFQLAEEAASVGFDDVLSHVELLAKSLANVGGGHTRLEHRPDACAHRVEPEIGAAFQMQDDGFVADGAFDGVNTGHQGFIKHIGHG